MKWIPIAKTTDAIEPNGQPLDIDGMSLALFRVGDSYHVLSNICTHEYALMTDGYLEDGYIECPMHQGRFYIPTGEAQGPPVCKPLKVFPVRIEADTVLVGLPQNMAIKAD